MYVILGCYTDAANPDGLKILELDERSGAMSVAAGYPVPNALYQALSPDGRTLYSCAGGGLASFKFGEGADLRSVDTISLGKCICHVAVMPDGRSVVFADYLGGFAGSVEVEDGKFCKVVIHQHSGSGPNLPRQDAAHCHQALPLPDGKGWCVADLGLDQIVEHPDGRVFHTQPAGAGPRHLLFHPDGRLAFLVSELGNIVSTLSWSRPKGFGMLHALPLLPAGDTGRGRNGDLAAAVRFTPDRKRVAVSNRGENSIAVYDFDEATGGLTFKSRTLLPGDWPRDFIFVGDMLALVACERSGEVLAMRYDATEGSFSPLSSLRGLHRPVALMERK